MELTPDQEAEIQRIMARTDCLYDSFRCYKSRFEDLAPVKAIASNGAIECLRAKESYCQMSYRFGFNTVLCRCPLRMYVAMNLGR